MVPSILTGMDCSFLKEGLNVSENLQTILSTSFYLNPVNRKFCVISRAVTYEISKHIKFRLLVISIYY